MKDESPVGIGGAFCFLLLYLTSEGFKSLVIKGGPRIYQTLPGEMGSHNMPRSRCEVWIHAVWTVKNREPLLHDKFRKKLFVHIYNRFRESPVIVDVVGGVADHVHCLFGLGSTCTVAKALKEIKGESSRLINSSLWVDGTFSWQEGYGAFSVSPSQLGKVRSYIYRQEQHHSNKSFEEELKLFSSLQQRGNLPSDRQG